MSARTLNLAETTVFIDFDGTISQVDVGTYLLAHFAPGRWEEIDDRYERGEIGSRQYLTEVSMLLPDDRALLQAVANEVPLDAGLGPLVELLRLRRSEVVVVSDGLGFYVAPLCAPYRLPIVANEMLAGRPLFPFADPTCSCGRCGTCKPAQLRAARSRGRTCVMVGDGTSDRLAAAQADLVFAKGGLRAWCQHEGLAFVPFDGLDEVEAALRVLDPAGEDEGDRPELTTSAHLPKASRAERQ